MLVLVATPIGNLKEISQRALDELTACDFVFCEDTRRTAALLTHFGLSKKIVRYNDHMPSTLTSAMDKLLQGNKVCLVSDGGMPCISDPGWKLVSEAIKKNIKIEVVSGPSAFVSAMAASGFPADSFLFLGFLSRSRGKMVKKLSSAFNMNVPVVFYESPHRIKKFMALAAEEFGDCSFAVVREISKVYEEWFRGSAVEILNQFEKSSLKGEFTVVAWRPLCEKNDKFSKKVLFVCTANTCRSVMAHYYAQKIFPPDFEIISAGLCANSQIEPPPPVFKLLSKEGIELKSHIPNQLTAEHIKESGIVLCMTHRHKEAVKGLFLEEEKKIFTLSSYAGFGEADIADPWGKGEDFYLMSFNTIKNCLKAVSDKLKNI